METKNDFDNLKNENETENTEKTTKKEKNINLNNLIDTKNTKNVKVELDISPEILKDIKKLNNNFYVDKYGIIREKIFYKIKKYTCNFIVVSGLITTFYYGIALPYYENPNSPENRQFALDKTNELSTKFFDFKLFGEEDKKNNEDKSRLINQLTNDIKNNDKVVNQGKTVKTITIDDEEIKKYDKKQNNKEITNKEKQTNISNLNKEKNNKEENNNKEKLIKSVEEMQKDIEEKEKLDVNSNATREIKKQMNIEEKNINDSIVIDESSDFYTNNGNEILNDVTPESDEPNDTKIEENINTPIFNDSKEENIKKLIENVDIKESSEN